MLRIEEVGTLSAFEKLQDEWHELQRASRAESIFLSYEWFHTCARTLPPGEEMLILLLRDGARLVGAAPLLRRRAQIRRFPVTQIGFLENPVSPFADFILIDPIQGLSAILGYLWNTHTEWDVLSLNKLRGDSVNLEHLSSFLRREGCSFQKRVSSRVPFLSISQPWDEFYQSKSQKFRKTRRSIANRTHRLGEVTVEHVTHPENASRAVEQMLTVSSRSWKRLQGADHLSPALEQAFFSELAQVSSRAGWLSLWLLKKGNEVLASEFHLNDRGTDYALRAAYDEACASCSPGTYLDFEIVRHLFQNGCSCYDMGPGMAEYKLAWTDSSYACHTFEIYNRKFYPRILGQLQTRWIPSLKASAMGRWLQGEPHP